MGFPYRWVNTRCANDGRIYTIPIPMAGLIYLNFYIFNFLKCIMNTRKPTVKIFLFLQLLRGTSTIFKSCDLSTQNYAIDTTVVRIAPVHLGPYL